MASDAGKRARQRRAMERSRERRERDRAVRGKHGAAGHSECGRKRRYDSEVDALLAAMWAEQRGALPLRAYRCRFCGGWHLTKTRKWKDGHSPADG